MHGGVERAELGKENVAAVKEGFINLARHVENLRKFGVPTVVAINGFTADTKAEVDQLRQLCAELGVEVIPCTHWADGGKGAEALARKVVEIIDTQPAEFRFLYPDDMPLWGKVQTIAQNLYGARGIIGDKKVRSQFQEYQDAGFGHFPVCMAKTQYSFSTDPALRGAPSNHVVPIREVRLSGGAEFLVVVCGEIMTMPGLPRVPAANSIRIDDDGLVQGLF
jgi:formate--tetrahydrofolate ligase